MTAVPHPARKGLKVTSHDERLFARAADLALWGQHERVRVGAVLAKSGRVVGNGYNTYRNPVDNVPHGYATVHAERTAIDRAVQSKCTLYVARLGLSDQLMPSWPCDECMIHIVACACVNKICYFDGQALVKVRL